MTVDFGDTCSKSGYQEENWKTRTDEREVVGNTGTVVVEVICAFFRKWIGLDWMDGEWVKRRVFCGNRDFEDRKIRYGYGCRSEMRR